MQGENRPICKSVSSVGAHVTEHHNPDFVQVICGVSVLKICFKLFIFSALFSQCLTPDIALSVLEDDGKAYLTEEDFQRMTTVLLYYIINLQDLCVSNSASPSSHSSSTSTSSSSSSGNYQFYLLALINLHPAEDNLFLSSSETESILQLINQHYNPSNQDASTSSDVQICHFLSEKYMKSWPEHIQILKFYLWSLTVYWCCSSPWRC